MLRAIILGIVQGLTEFLPISSSAHLSIVPRLLGYATPTLSFEVLLHFGTLAAVVAYFARDLWAFLLSLVAPGRLGPQETPARRRMLGLLALASVPAAVVGFLLQDWADQQTARPLRAAVWLVLTTAIMIAAELYDRARRTRPAPATAPGELEGGEATTGEVGGWEPLRGEVDSGDVATRAGLWTAGGTRSGERLGSPSRGPGTGGPGFGAPGAGARGAAGADPPGGVGGAAAGSGVSSGAGYAGGGGRVGRAARRAGGGAPATAEEELDRLPLPKAVGIGLGQALALIPGTSRSGITISVGLFEGVSREAAARFSFLLSIPAILGAGILKLDELGGATETPIELVAGTLAAAVSGFLAVSFLIRLLRTRTLWPFIWYRLVAGALFVLLLSTVRS
ncbi:MAG: undecaprenyl-diphosphate phosphatase [Actinomycetes bacterium]